MFKLFRRRRARASATLADDAAPGGEPGAAGGTTTSTAAADTTHAGEPDAAHSANGRNGAPHTRATTASPASDAPSSFEDDDDWSKPPGSPPEPPPPSGAGGSGGKGAAGSDGASGPPQSPEPPPPPRGLALDEIARGMQHAAAAANQLLAQQYMSILDTFFDSDDAGLLSPRAVELALDAEHTMPVPLVSLVTPRGLALEKMVVHLTVRGDFAEAIQTDTGEHRAHFHVTLAPPSKRAASDGQTAHRDTEHIDVEMHFAALTPPEAIMRVIDEYTHRLVPRARQANEEKPHA